MNFNEQTRHNFWSSYAKFDFKAKRLNAHVGCGQGHLDTIVKNPISKNQIEVSLANNFMELLVPSKRHFDMKDMLEIAKKQLKDSVPDFDDKIKQFGFSNIEGRI